MSCKGSGTKLGLHGRAVLLLVALSLIFLPSDVRAQQAPKKVLVVYQYNKDYSWNVNFDQSFRAVLHAAPAGSIEYYAEYLETDRFPEAEQSVLLHDYLRRKYGNRQIDVLVANSNASLEFLLKYRNDLFSNSPIIFIATKHPTKEQFAEHPSLTGIVNVSTHRKTLDLALRLHPNTEQVFVVSGNRQHDKRLETVAREELRGYENRVAITYITDRSPDELRVTMSNLPKRSLVLYIWQQSQDKQGKPIESGDIVASFAPATPVPIYGMANPAVGRGIVGGYINTASASGSRAAEITLRIANGVRIQDIPVETAPSFPIFDWRELRRWGIDERELPPGSIVRFRTLSLWEQYRGYTIAAAALILLQTALVAWLLVERRRRLQSEQARLQLATIVESSEDAIVGVSLDGKILTWNGGAELMYGYTAAEALGQSISIVVPPDRREELSLSLKRLKAGERIENFETVRLHKNGEHIDVSVGVCFIKDSRGRIIAAASIARDVSLRKRTEEALRDIEQESQKLAVRLFDLQDTERRRLARELHDVTAQNVFAMSMNLAHLQRILPQASQAEDLVVESRQLCDQSLQEIRTLCYLLHPPVLDQGGLVGALRWYVEGFVRRSGIKIDVNAIKDVGRLPVDVETALFRVVQESLTNISRHSGSNTAIIRLEKQDDQIFLQIVDHGHGMPDLDLAESDGGTSVGVGIPSMRQRLRQFGGMLQIESGNPGTVVTAKVPARSAFVNESKLVSR
jgi:PAS domain S-box-containing protein